MPRVLGRQGSGDTVVFLFGGARKPPRVAPRSGPGQQREMGPLLGPCVGTAGEVHFGPINVFNRSLFKMQHL